MHDVVVGALRETWGGHPAVGPRSGRSWRSVHSVVLSHRWQGRAVLVLFRDRRRSPWLVVKVDRDPRHQARLQQEHTTLATLDTYAAFTGMVPRSVGMLELPGAVALVQGGVPGSPLTSVLRRRGGFRPRHAADDLEGIRAWFSRFREHPDPARSEDRIDLAALGDDLVRILPPEVAALPWVERVSRDAAGAGTVSIGLQMGHGDLGPSNLLVSRRDLRLVDWETDVEPRSPLPDALTFVNHYARATPLPGGRLPSRDVAVKRALLGDDGLGRHTRRSWVALLHDHGIDRGAASLLAVRTMADLAGGRASTTHRLRGRRMWTELLVAVAKAASRRPERWQRSW